MNTEFDLSLEKNNFIYGTHTDVSFDGLQLNPDSQ